MTEATLQPAIELLLVLTVQTKLTQAVNGTPLGDHMIFDVVSGTFEGPQLSGRVPATGGDWVTRTAAGSRLDVRLLLETHDGITLLFKYTGKASQVDGQVRIEVAGTFEAPQGTYDWLNRVQAFGLGATSGDTVRYHFFRFK